MSDDTLRSLMVELEGADAETVNRIAWEKGSLPVRLAMLGLAALAKGRSPLWYGYPPGVFISYKHTDSAMREYVMMLAAHVRARGYRAFLDVENLDDDADAYFKVPGFITSLQDCSYYVLLLTEVSADLMTGRNGKTTWIHDEFQHAARITNTGRLVMIPLLLETRGATDFFSSSNVIDLTADNFDFSKLDELLPREPPALTPADIGELTQCVEEFDSTFLAERWDEAHALLLGTAHLDRTFDHQFRRMLHAIYTADQEALGAVLEPLHATYGAQHVFHIYSGYCNEHGIPNRSLRET